MAKQLNVDLNFRANTTQAQQQIMQLQSLLQKIAVGSDMNIDASKMKAASEAAKELSIHLNNAFNVNTGNFDLSKLDKSLKTSSTNITELSSKLLNAGATGQTAFVQLAQTIAAADRPVVTLNSKLTGLMTTLKNTARWQISSSILHGFIGAVQQAYGYAQDLNASLNDIRIVSGQSSEQMAQFAEQANKAAKNLSTTTTAYTKAALIFYQQGDKGSTITEKSDVVTKMANVTGQNTSMVADQLTAIWNNFNKSGDEAYEHYADVLTALGAATASSTDEIAGGLEKFAGIAETVGLSYDYAAAALATITATSRESEQVVGTALKTIFSRIQGLNLGETLDDGTDLNKYSEALMKVGISIKDQNGEIKEMDKILDEMGAKWKDLSNDQQMALAQAVAGVRQYNQLMTLMNNWDFMQENVAIAENADGTLQEQQEIYEESWKAANERVRASMEAIYSDLIDDEFFIDIANGFSALIDSVDAFIDGVGGVKTIIMGIGSFFLASIANKIQPALQNLKHTFSVVFQSAEQQAKSLATEMNASIVEVMGSKQGQNFTDSSKVALQNAMQLNNAKAKLQAIEQNLNNTEKQRFQQQLSLLQISQDEAQAVADKITKRKEEIALLATQFDYEKATKDLEDARGREEEALRARRAAADEGNPMREGDTSEALTQAILKHSAATDNLRSAREAYTSALYESYAAEMEATQGNIANSQKEYEIAQLMPGVLEEYASKMESIVKSKKAFSTQIDSFRTIKQEIDLIVGDSAPALSKALSKAVDSKTPTELAKNMKKVQQVMQKAKIPASELEKILRKFGQGKNVGNLISQYKNLSKEQEELKKKQEAVNRAVNEFNPKHTVTGIETITKMASGLGQVAMAAQSARSMFQAWANDDLSFGEKLTTSLMSISMIIPGVIGGIKNLNSALQISAIAQQALSLAAQSTAVSESQLVAAMTAEQIAAKMKVSMDQAQLILTRAKVAEVLKETSAYGSQAGALTAKMLVEKTGITTEQAAIIVKKMNSGATISQALAEAGLTTAKGAGTAATIAQTIANWALNASMSPLLLIALLLVGAFLLLAGAALGIVAIFNAIKNSSPEAQLESARAATEAAKEAAEGAKEAYDNLLSTIEKYDGAVGALEGLAKGTQEYTDKLLEANAAARELIDTYGLTDFTVEDGLIKLNPEEIENKKSEYNNRVEDTSGALTGAQKYENSKEDVITKRDLYNDVMSKSTHYATTSDGYSYKDNYLINQSNMDTVMKAANEAEGGWDAYFADGKNNIATTMGWDPENLNSYQQDFINALMNSSSALETANAAILANAAANEAATKAQLAQNLSDEEKFQDSDYQDELIEAALNTQGQTEADAQTKLDGMTQDQMYNAYAEMMGYTNNGIGTWLDGKQEFLDKDGNKIELTPEQVKAQMKEMYSQEGMEQNALNLIDTMNKVMARADENKGVISTAITGDTEKLTIGQQGMSADEVAAMVTDEEAQAMGFESAAAFGESFASATESFAGEWQSLMGNYVDSVSDQMQTMFDNGELDNLTLGQSENLANAFETAYATSGQAGMDVLAKMFTDAGEYSDEFANALGTIDWSTATPETLQDALDAAGVATHYTADELNNLINVMNEGAMGFENAANKYKTLSEIVDSLKSGDTITAEQFKELGPGMEDYFMRMADGTYKLIGDAEAFYAAVNEQQLEGFENTITAKTEDNAGIQNVLNHDIGSLGTIGSTTMGGHYYTGGGNFVQNTDVANAQLDFLEQTGYDPAQVQQWRDDMQAGTLDVKALTTAVNEQTTSLGGAAAAEEYLTQQLDANNTEIEQSKEAIASTATSLDELDQMLQDGKISVEAYDKAAQGAFEKEVEAEGFDTEELNNYVDALIESGKFLEENRKEAQKFALAQYRMEKGCTELVESYEDWDKVLSDNEASLKDINKVMPKVNSMLQDMMDLSDEEFALLPDNFAKDNWNLIQDVYNEVDGAYEALRAKITEEIIMNIGLDQSQLTEVQSAVDTFLANVDLDDIEVGTTLDQTGFSAGLQNLLDSGAVTVDQMNDILSGIGYEPIIEYEQVAVSSFDRQSQQGYIQVAGVDGSIEYVPITSDMDISGEQYVYVPKIGSSKYKGGGGGVADAKANKGGGGGGGGGSKPKKADKVKKTDVVDRYKEIDDKLDDIADKMDDASKAADRLWGPARLKQMKKVNDALEEEIDALKKKRKEAQDNLDIDKKALKDTISAEAGVTITDADFDAEGNFTRYDEILTDLYNEIDAAIEAANADGNADEDEQEKIDKIQERIDKVKEAIDQYDETRELIEDLDNDIQDKIYEWQDNNYEQLNYKLEYEIEINDSELELLEYYMGKAEGNIYKTAEAFGYLAGQADIYTDNLKHQEEYVNELTRAYYAGEISMDAYKEGLREAQSATIENLQALEEQKKAMQEYYGEVMDMALEEISLYTDEMEELNSVLDHYSNILELVGKQEDYATKGKVLQSKATNLRNEMQVQQKLYEKSNAEAEDWAAKMATAIEGSNEYETYKKNWIAAQEAANEAQENMLSKTEEWAEAMKAVIENELAGLAKTMEESLTGGTSFDELLTSMERRSSLQEEYLTTTNQIYETNKLMRQAQQEIDKTTNSVAKRKLANFINETEQMQNQTELSQYELDIQQAKYDLLLAEIALEEAQSAKSTVRLQRDSEGNFGYVYTADQSAVGEAEQELADKQNALYNLGLEGANDYSQKYAETMQEAQDAITELTEMWMNGEIESEEEYQRRKSEIQDYYYEKLKQYSSLYQVALTTDSNVIKDAWSTDFGDMMYKTEDWKVATDDYFAGAAESMKTWAEVCGTVLEESGLDDVSKKVEEINTKSENLKNTLIGEDGEGGVVGAMMSEVEAAGKLSEAYIGIQNQIDETIKKYEEMMGVINEDYTDPDTEVVDPAIDPEPEPEEPAPEPEPPTTPAAEGPTYQTGTLTWTGNGASRIWKDSTGKTYKYGSPEQKAIQKAFDRAYGANGGYKGDYWGGWNKLNADVLHKKYGLATGGYTGDWAGSYGKLAFLHQKELVLNAGDTENFLAGMDLLDKIVSAIDLYSMNSQLGGALSSPSLGNMGGGDVLEQQVHIEASFPGVQDRNEIEEAFNTLINRASQYANRK